MTKQAIIKKIKTIIENFGSFNTAEVEAASSPCLKNLGRHTCQLLESFSLHKAEAVTYVHEQETATDYIKYEDLSLNLLKEILQLAKEWEEINGGTEGLKEKLVDTVIERLKEDFKHNDYTVLDELLKMIPDKNLVQALPEEMWTKFPNVKLK